MAKVVLTNRQKIADNKNKIRKFLKGRMAENDITMLQMGNAVNAYQQQVSLTLRGKSDAYLLEMLMAVCSMTDTTAEEIQKLLKIGGMK